MVYYYYYIIVIIKTIFIIIINVEGERSGVAGGRAKEVVALLLSGWLLRCAVEWKMSSRLMWIRVKIERESWVFISAYGPV